MDLYDILACPTCKVGLTRQGTTLVCASCSRVYPVVHGVPVLFPDASLPTAQHEAELDLRTGYNPWIERVVLQSLPAGAIALDLGAGNMALDLPHVIRMDVTLTPYVDVVGDAHALPFLPGSLDFIFSLAVIEHLRQPFVATHEMYQALKPGGYVYGECNFIYPYHGYPHHYFNASQQGLQQLFAAFTQLRCSVAPYQMPSFAIRTTLDVYKHTLAASGDPRVHDTLALIENLCDQPLAQYDGLLSEAAALRLAAGVFFFGVKLPAGQSQVIPAEVQAAWRASAVLQQRFPELLNLGTPANVMQWALHEAATSHPELSAMLGARAMFHKHTRYDAQALAQFQHEPVVEAAFGHIHDTPRAAALSSELRRKEAHIALLEAHIKQLESGRVMRLLRRLKGH